MEIVQSAGPLPGLQNGPEALTSMFHSPPVGPVMFIWDLAPIAFAASPFFTSAAGRSSLKSFLMSTAIGFASSGLARSESRFSGAVKRPRDRRQRLGPVGLPPGLL